jgi:maltooligosyltrehalose trehalohydrolase
MAIIREIWTLELGAGILNEGVHFKVWAPRAERLSLRVEGKSRDILMVPEEKGYFTVFARDLAPGTKYFYLLDGDRARPDPVSRYQPEGVHGPSEVIDPRAFEWQDHSWRGIPLEEMIIYEIHVGTFTPEGTFGAILPFVDYLKKDLGVTTVELMPVAQFPGERNWGYDGTCLYAPQNSYGGPLGLKTLVNACHRKGLAVILDVVYNHLGPEGNYLNDYGPYFTDRYKTPWGPAINLDGPESDEVRRFIIHNALYWVTEFHLDGLRMDAVQGIFDLSVRHILEELREAVHRQARRLGRPVAVMAESDLNDPRVIASPRRGGFGLDAQWNDDFHHALHALITRERSGYYQDFGDLDQMSKAIEEGFVFSGQYSSFRRRRHGGPSARLLSSKFIVFSQNHDQVGNRMRGERLSTLATFEALKLAAGVVLLSPHIPLLFMGEEYGEEAPFLYFTDHSDPSLIDSVRQGRKAWFSLFGEGGEPPDPQDASSFLCSKLRWGLRRQKNHQILLNYYQNLIILRKQSPALSHPSKTGLDIKTGAENSWLLMRRSHEDEQVYCIFNFSENPAALRFSIRPGIWRKILESSSTRWGGPGGSTPPFLRPSGREVCFTMRASSLVLYRNQPSHEKGPSLGS